MSRRKSVFEVSTAQQVQLRQQEEPLSNEIDQNLRTLALVRPLTDAAKPLLVKNAFLKANKLAFHHVIHYLVNLIIGLTAYRKRFRWPIVSSKDDADFRTAVLAYFNECHTNFKWTIGPFKMHVVHFPGGIEFMKIIVELSKVAMQTVLKENDSLHLINSNGMGLREAKAKLQAAQQACAEWEKLFSELRALIVDIKERTSRLQEVMGRVLKNTSITEEMIATGFLSDWEKTQQENIDNEIIPQLQQLENWYKKCKSIEQHLSAINSVRINFDKDKMSALGLLQMSNHFDPQIDYDKLYAWFFNAMPAIVNAVHFKPPWSLSRLQNESQILDKYLSRTNALYTRLDVITFELPIPMDLTSDGARKSDLQLNVWRENLILTPTMSSPVEKDSQMSIWDAFPTMDLPAPKQTSAAVTHHSTTSSDNSSGFYDGSATALNELITTRTTSTKLDPMAMLNTATQRNKGLKNPSTRRNMFESSPSRLNSMAVCNSTMITEEGQLKTPSSKMKFNRIGLSPLRKNLF